MNKNKLGIYGPQIMLMASLPFLWTRITLIGFLIGFSFSVILNDILKMIFQGQRPGMSDEKYMMVKKQDLWYWIVNDPFGFPSGHAQNSAFIAAMIYNAFGLKPITLVFALYTVFIMWQRVDSKKHTISQVIAGAITGVVVAAGVYYVYKRGLAGYIIRKVDDCSLL